MNKDKIIEQLKKLGLSDKASIIYMALLELGGAYPSKVAEHTKLNRSTVYKILMDLSIKGLINEIQRKKKLYYQIENPKKIIKFAKDKIKMDEEKLVVAKKLCPELEDIFSSLSDKPKISFYQGNKECLSIYENHINVKSSYELLGISNVGEVLDFLPKSFQKKYVKSKEKLNITSRGIVPDKKSDRLFNDSMYKWVNKKIHPKLKFIQADKFPFKSEITIYGKNKVSIVNFGEKGLIGIIIEDETIHGMMKMVFELAWRGIE